MPAVALANMYSGPGLGVSWTLHGKRGAFVGTFAPLMTEPTPRRIVEGREARRVRQGASGMVCD